MEISGCEFSNNYGYEGGGAVFSIVNTDISLVNCTISDNQSPYGGGIEIHTGQLTVLNSIISFSDMGSAIAAVDTPDIYIYYSDIYGNAGGDWTPAISEYLGLFGNLHFDPLYAGLYEGDYRLQFGSPCIDAGDPQSPDDPDGTPADMGAYYYNHLTAIDDKPLIPEILRLSQNYPNPFNSSTVIEYNLSRVANVRIEVYDLLGRKIETLVDAEKQTGTHTITFDASGLSSGVYFYRLQAGNVIETKSMVLLK